MNRHHARKGFTLIELLVVIAIIAILAAILFPVFAQAKDQAKKATNISNLKQIALAGLMYANDNDDHLFPFGTAIGNWRNGGCYEVERYWWGSIDRTLAEPEVDETGGLLYPYVKTGEIDRDPVAGESLRTALGDTGYALNVDYLGPANYPDLGCTFHQTVPTTIANDPAKTLWLAQSARMNYWSGPPTLEGNVWMSPPSSNYPTMHGRHAGNGVVAWVDGHASTEKPVYRDAPFDFGGTDPAAYRDQDLGDIDEDGDFTTDELFDLD